MAKSPDHPGLNFVQASGYTKGRPDGPPLWIVVHDMEAGESSDRAENTASYFAGGAGGRGVSSHYCVDNNSVIQCVLLKDTAWTVGNRPGNNRGINWEFSGFARQTRAQWLDPFGMAMFREAAPYIRADAARFGIPLRRCSVADLKALRPGVTSHNDLRVAFGGTTHTDPGPAFPWDVFIEILQEGDDMATPLEIWSINAGSAKNPVRALDRLNQAAREAAAANAGVAALTAVVKQLADHITAGGGSVDTAAILAGVDQRLAAFRELVRADVDDELDEHSRAGADTD
jgi:hypothetical protein